MVNSSTQYNSATQPCCFIFDVMGWRLNINFMYQEELTAKQPTTQAEHLSIATSFSNDMMERFNPEQVNEILHHIKQMFKERREMEIAEAQKKLAYLQNTIEAL